MSNTVNTLGFVWLKETQQNVCRASNLFLFYIYFTIIELQLCEFSRILSIASRWHQCPVEGPSWVQVMITGTGPPGARGSGEAGVRLWGKWARACRRSSLAPRLRNKELRRSTPQQVQWAFNLACFFGYSPRNTWNISSGTLICR